MQILFTSWREPENTHNKSHFVYSFAKKVWYLYELGCENFCVRNKMRRDADLLPPSCRINVRVYSIRVPSFNGASGDGACQFVYS
jgi:hypothetical protein